MAQLLHLLILVAALHSQLLADHSGGAAAAENHRRAGGIRWTGSGARDKRAQSAAGPQGDMNSGCDLLFAAGGAEQLASFCSCRDSSEPVVAHNNDDQDDDSSRSLLVGQLDCRHANASYLLAGLRTALRGATRKIKIDYLSIRTNVTYDSRGELPDGPGATTGSVVGPPAEVEQLALSLAVVEGHEHAPQRDTIREHDQRERPIEFVENFLSSLLGGALLASDRLHSLTLVVELAQPPALGAGHDQAENPLEFRLNLNTHLARLAGLTRLEVSLTLADDRENSSLEAAQDSQKPTLVLDNETLRAQAGHLQWLNLASNSRMDFGQPDEWLARLASLEYLSLESSNLDAFPLCEHLGAPEVPHRNKTLAGRAPSEANAGLSNLSSLNLARNKFASLEHDLLACVKTNSSESRKLRLPSLSQLDLSHNQLASISPREARLVLESFPQLANLYLQHNKIMHLNLNALLGLGQEIVSRLEFLDLSHNRLVHLEAAPLPPAALNQHRTRMKSINLAHNQLGRPLRLVDPKLIDLLKFDDERLTSGPNQSTQLVALNSSRAWAFDLGGGVTSSICDYLSSGQVAPGDPAAGTADQSEDIGLGELLLEHNDLARLEAHDFAGASCRALEVLRLSDNSISRVASGTFRGLVHLQVLDLSGNELAELPPGLFDHLLELRILNLGRNKLARLVPGALSRGLFAPLVRLQELHLQQNELESFRGAFDSASEFSENSSTNQFQLRLLDLSKNNLAALNASALLGRMGELTHLNLGRNKNLREFDWTVLFSRTGGGGEAQAAADVKSIPKPAGRKSAKLKAKKSRQEERRTRRRNARWALATKRMASGDDEEPPPPPPLPEELPDFYASPQLVLSHAQLVSFGPSAGPNSPNCDSLVESATRNLQVLRLDHNSLRELANRSFSCFAQLELLDLSSNQLRVLNEAALEPLRNLRHLNLANNYLVHLGSGFLTKLAPATNLRHLDLSRNQLGALGFPATERRGVERGAPELEFLDLSDNFNLRLETNELLALIESSRLTLRTLRLSRISSIWGKPARNESSSSMLTSETGQHTLELDLLDLGQVRQQVDKHFLGHLSRMHLRVRRFTFGPRSDHEASLLGEILSSQKFQTSELVLGPSQLTGKMLEKVLLNSTSPVDGQSQITRLDLSQTKLTEWPLDSIELLAKLSSTLVQLDLSESKLAGQLFESKIFKKIRSPSTENASLSQLEVLNLRSNSLTSICGEGGAGRGLAQELAQYSDQKLCERMVAGLVPNLRHLDVSHNNLDSLPSRLLEHLARLETLRLEHNRLGLVAPSLGLRLSPHLRLLDLSSSGGVGPAQLDFSENSNPPANIESSPRATTTIGNSAGEFIVHTGEQGRFECHRLGDFGARLRDQLPVPPTNFNPSQSDELSETSEDERQFRRERSCEALLGRPVRQIKLDNSSRTWAHLAAQAAATREPVTLSLTGNKISSPGGEVASRFGSSTAAQVVHLDLSRNVIESVALAELCSAFPFLQTLELSGQANLREVLLKTSREENEENPEKFGCPHLTYLNLGNNKLRQVFRFSRLDSAKIESLRALSLDRNHLSHLDDELLLVLPRLRYLDLRSNRFTQVALRDFRLGASLWAPNLILFGAPGDETEFALRLAHDMGSLQIRVPGLKNSTIEKSPLKVTVSSLSQGQPVALQVQNQTSYLLRFCTLNRSEAQRVCLKKLSARSEADQAGAPRQVRSLCFALRPPAGPSCLTNIDAGEQLAPAVAPQQLSGEPARPPPGVFSAPNKTRRNQSELDSPDSMEPLEGLEQDAVLSFIDRLKWAWLRVRQFDLATYLAQVSQIRQDSVLFTLGKGQPVHTLTAIKLAIIVVALCVILLLIAMFALLTATVTGGGGGNSSTGRRKLRRQNKVFEQTFEAHEDEHQAPENHRRAAAGSTSSSNEDDSTPTTTTTSGARQASKSSTRSDSTRPTRIQQQPLSAGQLFQQQQQQQVALNCSTPSSSLAPSSVETGETMQALDSMHSSSTHTVQQVYGGSQRTLLAGGGPFHEPPPPGPHLFQSVDQYQLGGQGEVSSQVASEQQVATVMRMVKSSTFDGLEGGALPVYGDQQDSGQGFLRAYGTLQGRPQQPRGSSAYGNGSASTLARLRNRAPAQPPAPPQRQIYAPQSMSFTGELDPATLSLLSLNSQLSGQQRPEHGHEHNNGPSESNEGQQTSSSWSSTTTQDDHNPASLCHYHTRIMRSGHDQEELTRLLHLGGHRSSGPESGHVAEQARPEARGTTAQGASASLFALVEEELEQQQQQQQTANRPARDNQPDWRGAYLLATPPPPPPPAL